MKALLNMMGAIGFVLGFVLLSSLISCDTVFRSSDVVGNFIDEKTDAAADALIRGFDNWCRFDRDAATREFVKRKIADAIARARTEGSKLQSITVACQGPNP